MQRTMEFIVVLPSTALAGAQHVAESIRLRLAALDIPHQTASAASYVTVSVGVASMLPQQGSSYNDLVAAADAALYEAKKAGRNRIHVVQA